MQETEYIRFTKEGDIFVFGRLIETDKELADALRDLVFACNSKTPEKEDSIMNYADQCRLWAKLAHNPKSNRTYRKILNKCEKYAKQGGTSITISKPDYKKIEFRDIQAMLESDGFKVRYLFDGMFDVSWN